MNVIEIDRIVRRGAASLAESLHYYWPQTGNNEAPERNISIHLGRAFLDAGFLVYGETHSRDDVNTRLDLLAIDPSAGALVACEFKRLYSQRRWGALGRGCSSYSRLADAGRGSAARRR